MHEETPLDQSSLVITPYGEAAYRRLATAVGEAKGDDPLAPVTVVTPTHYVALAAARTLASSLRTAQNPGNGIAAAEFVTVDDLAKRLGGGRIAASGLNLVSNTVIAGTVRTILRNDPGYFAGIETHPATEKALAAAHKELSEISADRLDALAEQSERVADVVRIHHEVSAILYPHVDKNMEVNSAQGGRLHSGPRFCNFRQLVEQAEIALKFNAGVAEQLGVVVLFLPQHLAYGKIKLLRSVMSITPTTIIAGFTGFYDADAAVRSSLAGLPAKPTFTHSRGTDETNELRRPTPHAFDPRTGEDRKTNEINELRPPTPHAFDPRTGGSRTTNEIEHLRRLLKERVLKAVSVSDPDDEVRHAVREIISAARSGKKLGKCAIVYGSSQPYARLIGDALDVAGIKHCGADVHAANTSWLGRTVTGLLNLYGNGFSRQRVMAWLDKAHIEIPYTDKTQENDADHKNDADRKNSSPHSQDVSSKSSPAAEPFPPTENVRWQMAPTAAWERIARAARVNTGLSDWESRLRLYIDGRRSEAERIIDNSISEQYLSLAQHYNQQAKLAEQLLALINRLYNHLHPKPLPNTWTELAEWCQQLIRRYCDNKKRRSGWPDHEKKLADKVYEAIDRLSTLDGFDDDPSPVRFRHALEVELAGSHHTRGLFGSGVLVGPPGLIFGLELDLLVVCGMAEGVFPSRHHVNALLPDMERLNTATELHVNSARNSDQHREFLSAIASSKRILLLYPRGDLHRSTENSPSRWLLDIAEAIDPQGIRPKGDDLTSATGSWFEEIPSFVSSLRRMNFPANEQEYDTHVLFRWHEQHKAGQRETAGQHKAGQRKTTGQHKTTGQRETAGQHKTTGQHNPRSILQNHVVVRRPALKRGFELALARKSSRFTRFDGNLHTDGNLRGAELPNPASNPISASRLEAWVRCPHAYFVRHILGVEPIEDELDNYRISPLDLGSATHEILERWMLEVLEAEDTPKPHEPWSMRWIQRLLDIAGQRCDYLEKAGLSGQKIYWHSDRKRLMDDLRRFIDFDNDMRSQHKSTPIAAELGFGLPGAEYGPVNVELPYSLTQLCNPDETPNRDELSSTDSNPRVDDQTEESVSEESVSEGSVSASNSHHQRILSIRGAIDRLDLSEAGGLVVVDYKTGSNRPYQRLKAEDPNPEGGHLQLVLYTLAARQLILQAKTASEQQATTTLITPRTSSANASAKTVSEQQATTTSGDSFTGFSTSDENTRLSAISKRISFKESLNTELNTEEDQGEYWFVSSKGGFTSKGYPVHSVEAQVLKTTAAIVECIGSGIFPKRGAAKDGRFGAVCRFCSPDGLSMRAVNLAWKRKLEDPVIRRYLEIVAR